MSPTTTSSSSAASLHSPNNMQILSTTVVTKTGGRLLRCQHASWALKCNMIFSIFLPHTYVYKGDDDDDDDASSKKKTKKDDDKYTYKTMYWLSGLTCTDQNFCTKAGPVAFARCDHYGMALVVPDTSPRSSSNSDNATDATDVVVVPDDASYDLGQGAGFYINATQSPWKAHYQMYTYIQQELPVLVMQQWPALEFTSICGHSMGGHGALTLALKSRLSSADNNSNNKDKNVMAVGPIWKSVSALAPICHPTACPWGQKAFQNYLGSIEAGKEHDATELIAKLSSLEKRLFDIIMIDEGTADEFGQAGQLLLSDLEAAAAAVQQPLQVRRLAGMDHSYYFIAACIADHIDFHAQQIGLISNQSSSKSSSSSSSSK